jgi:uncharacterized membrane protein YeaQ/YmgE (transglycosylase-associated protein family)
MVQSNLATVSMLGSFAVFWLLIVIFRRKKMIHFLWMFIIGIVVGAIARLIIPGSEHLGILMTGLLGIAGSFVGGFIARLFSKPADGAMVHPAGLILSIVGAVLLLVVWNHVAR